MSQVNDFPLISVIVPVHNGQDYLENCIDSILDQTYRPLEIIVVDDGSTDKTGEILKKLKAAHSEISVITMEDEGVSAARNRGVGLSKGSYVTFVDADDRIHPQMLEVLYNNLVHTKSQICGCKFFTWSDEEKWEAQKKSPAPAEKKSSDMQEAYSTEGLSLSSQEEFALNSLLLNDTRCWSKLYERECMEKVSFREGLSIGEDMLFLVELLPHVKRVAAVEFEGYGYYRNPVGAMNRRFTKSYMDQIRCWEIAGEKMSDWARDNKELTEAQKEQVKGIMAARLITGIMLTAGKIAVLSGKERKVNREFLDICRKKLKECLKEDIGLDSLDADYIRKIRLFDKCPGVYVFLYGTVKRMLKKA